MINRIMKGSVIALFLVFIFSFLALAENQPEPRLISVTGEAEVKVVPDEVVLTLGVETWDKDLNVAKNQNDERVKKVLAVAKKHKIQSKDTQTDCISIEPRYEDQWQHRNFAGYFVSKRIALTLRDISKFEGLLSNSLEAGANYVYGIRFRTTELRKYKDQARVLAVRAAKEKAIGLARELGQKIGKPYKIQEERVEWWSWYGMNQNVTKPGIVGDFLGNEGSIALGQINVTAKITVSFELE